LRSRDQAIGWPNGYSGERSPSIDRSYTDRRTAPQCAKTVVLRTIAQIYMMRNNAPASNDTPPSIIHLFPFEALSQSVPSGIERTGKE
jgi:hypothetical protein